MFRSCLVLLAVAVALPVSTPAAAQSGLDLGAMLEQAQRFTVKVRGTALWPFAPEQMGTGLGTGFIIDREKGWILTNSRDDWAVWSIMDDGDVAPRWKIPVRALTGGGRQNAGIAIIPKFKEIMIASSQMNKVVTFYFPELFE